MAGNPRIDDLRKRLEKEPQSRLFAQLAEELRKDGDLAEAIGVAREGLKNHPSYPSARMTLGRALFDTGDFAAARAEFEQVLKGAPDNILASRLLGECLENLGDVPGAVARYKATLALAPGDKQVTARLAALEGAGGGARPAAPAAPGPSTAGLRPPSAAAAPPPPVGPGRTTTPAAPPEEEAAAEPEPEPPPIKLVEADEEFELERPYEAPVGAVAPPEPPRKAEPEPRTQPPPPADAARTVEAAPLEADFATDFGATTLPPGGGSAPTPPEDREFLSTEEFRAVAPGAARTVDLRGALPTVDVPAVLPGAGAAPPPQAAGTKASGPEAADLASPTLAELYFNQGLVADAIRVYEQLLEREPGHERYAARLAELRSPAPDGPPDPAAHRRALERTIARLEGLLAAIKRG